MVILTRLLIVLTMSKRRNSSRPSRSLRYTGNYTRIWVGPDQLLNPKKKQKQQPQRYPDEIARL